MIKIGTVEIPDMAAFDVTVSHPPIQSKSVLRTKNGTGILQSRWKKLGTIISGSGWIPDGLDNLDENATVDIHSTASLSSTEPSNVITIPRVFRSDEYSPQGIAFVNGEMVETNIVLNGFEATLTSIPSAISYQVIYWPVLTSIITLIDRQFDEQANVWNWTIEAEEK